jgi:hypothetical protein
MSVRGWLIVFLTSLAVGGALADEVLYQYEGDVLPYDESAGWSNANPCEAPCSEALEGGHFVLQWPEPNDLANYYYLIAEPREEPPTSLWVEWRFRSNHPMPPHSYTCDATFTAHYADVIETICMYGDAAVSFSGDDVITGLDIDEFHTYRFESYDGVDYTFAVDGPVFTGGTDDQGNGYHSLSFSGRGGCPDDWIPDMVNEWDFIRFGTLSEGERIMAADPPAGYLDPEQYPEVDRFTVTFDSPAYVYVDDITIEVTGGVTPAVIQTRRGENDGSDTLEVVLDAPIPMGERTTFYFDTGQGGRLLPGHSFHYTYLPDPIPAVSEWGMVVMVLLVLAAGSVVFSRTKRQSLAAA